jgi:hypothetical protein
LPRQTPFLLQKGVTYGRKFFITMAPGPWLQEIIILAEESLKSEQKMKKKSEL